MGRVKRALQRRGFERSKNKQEAFLVLFLGMFLGYLFSYAIRQHFSANLKVKTVCRRTGTRFEPRTRPGNLSTELAGRRTFLLIGIMTADHLLATRAKTIHSTWGNEVNSGKVLFFSGGVRNAAVNFTVVRLPGVDDGYPPQRKSFHMLRYLYDHYIDNFHWFVRADDDVYVRTERLSVLLRTLNSSDDLVIGQAGTGKPQEKGRLGLQQDDNFCLGGPGVVMSQSVLRKVAPYLSTCLNETVSLHEDVELSRCVRRYVGVICPWAQEVSFTKRCCS